MYVVFVHSVDYCCGWTDAENRSSISHGQSPEVSGANEYSELPQDPGVSSVPSQSTFGYSHIAE